MDSTGISERIGIAPPRPRLERVTAWLAASKLDALVVTGPALVNWLTGYSRYYGGPSAAVITPAGERTLVVVRDETGPAEQLSGADHVIGYSERGSAPSHRRPGSAWLVTSAPTSPRDQTRALTGSGPMTSCT